MAYKDLIKTNLISAIKQRAKDNILLNFILDSRKEFVELRLNQEAQIQNVFKQMETNILTYLDRLPDQLTEAQIKALDKFVNGVTVDLRFDLDKIINTNLKNVIENVGETYKGMFEAIVNKANIRRVDTKLFSKAVDKNNQKIYAVITNRIWSKKGTGYKLSGRIWKSSLYARNGIKDVIKAGLDKDLSTQQIAKNITKYMKPNAQKTILKKELALGRKTPSNPHYFAMRVARSEIQASYQDAMYSTGAIMPNYKGIIWILSNRHPEYDICDELANTKKYGEKGFFPKGKEPTLPHPHCLCSQVQEFGDLDNFIDELKAWEENPKSNKTIENWYNKYMK